MKKWLFVTVLTRSLMAFEDEPWVIEPLKPDVKLGYTYNFFSKVHGYAANFYDNQVFFQLDVAFPNHFQLGLEFNQDATTFHSFYFRDAAVEIKKQFLDDLAEGDGASAATGIRAVAQTPEGRLDPTTFYPGGYHFIGFVSLGKEWSFDVDQYFRIWAVADLGVATHASLWADFKGFMLYRKGPHEVKMFALSALGYGASEKVDISHFKGWGETRYRTLDLGFTYGYEVASQFFIKAGFTKRALSKVMPRNYNAYSLIFEKIF